MNELNENLDEAIERLTAVLDRLETLVREQLGVANDR